MNEINEIDFFEFFKEILSDIPTHVFTFISY